MNAGVRKVSDRVGHMLEAIENIRSDIGPLDQARFLNDGKTQRAVIESLVVLGEAASRVMQLMPAIKDSQPHLWQQFRDVADMRNLLTHEYFRVDASIVWTTVVGNMPELEADLAKFHHSMRGLADLGDQRQDS
jgi:uncharacterized protein with HEPN domain